MIPGPFDYFQNIGYIMDQFDWGVLHLGCSCGLFNLKVHFFYIFMMGKGDLPFTYLIKN